MSFTKPCAECGEDFITQDQKTAFCYNCTKLYASIANLEGTRINMATEQKSMKQKRDGYVNTILASIGCLTMLAIPAAIIGIIGLFKVVF